MSIHDYLNKRDEQAKTPLDDYDWVQLEMAARECTSGIENWPDLQMAIKKVMHLKQLQAEALEMRFAIACGHSGAKLYMDDGEMQDSTRRPFIDFKRDSWDEIKEKMHQRRITELHGHINAKKPGAAATPWGTDPWKRAGGECVCPCGLQYRLHKTESGPGYGSCGDEILVLNRLCDGTLVHL